MTKNQTNKGFTLVELSIVIIIIGFLVAGISAGTSLIQSAKLDSVITDFQKYQTAYNNFLGRYSYAPGDFPGAYAIWGANCSADSTKCNGNGNGLIDGWELYSAWTQLALAGMINDYIDPSPTSFVNATPGLNCPNSKISGAGYGLYNADPAGFGFGVLWGTPTPVNMIVLGAPSTSPGAIVNNGVLSPVDAYSIDHKIDDGQGNLGNIRALDGVLATPGDCLDTSTAGVYNLPSALTNCMLAMGLNN